MPSGPSRSIKVSSVLQVNNFVEKTYVTLATALATEPHMRGGAKKRQRDASPGGIS